jgi:hypothetical protein
MPKNDASIISQSLAQTIDVINQISTTQENRDRNSFSSAMSLYSNMDPELQDKFRKTAFVNPKFRQLQDRFLPAFRGKMLPRLNLTLDEKAMFTYALQNGNLRYADDFLKEKLSGNLEAAEGMYKPVVEAQKLKRNLDDQTLDYAAKALGASSAFDTAQEKDKSRLMKETIINGYKFDMKTSTSDEEVQQTQAAYDSLFKYLSLSPSDRTNTSVRVPITLPTGETRIYNPVQLKDFFAPEIFNDVRYKKFLGYGEKPVEEPKGRLRTWLDKGKENFSKTVEMEAAIANKFKDKFFPEEE